MAYPDDKDCPSYHDPETRELIRDRALGMQLRNHPWGDVSDKACGCTGGKRKALGSHDLPSDAWVMLWQCLECRHVWEDFHEG